MENLSPREIEVILLLIDGLSNKEIARKLGISYQTVKNHIIHIFQKLNVVNRTQAVTAYTRFKAEYRCMTCKSPDISVLVVFAQVTDRFCSVRCILDYYTSASKHI